MIPHRSIAAAVLLLLTSASIGQVVYRCGQTYQDSPCVGGRIVDVTDERSDAQRAAAAQTTRRETALGTQMQKDRMALEQSQRPARAIDLSPRAKTQPTSETKQHAPKPKKIKVIKPTKKADRPLPRHR